ncbi:MAG TPA: hypothetical protein VJJ22_03650 [Candidatus Paceibacterota bacterium]
MRTKKSQLASLVDELLNTHSLEEAKFTSALTLEPDLSVLEGLATSLDKKYWLLIKKREYLEAGVVAKAWRLVGCRIRNQVAMMNK